MGRKFKVLSRADGYSENNLLQYGIDHIRASKFLLKQSPACYDSAGYLFHIGIELIIKSWLLYIFDSFDKDHNLKRLYGKITKKYPSKKLSLKHYNTLLLLDKFEELRYPTPENPIEIGSDESQKIEELTLSILKKMPKKHYSKILAKISITNKGNRVLMEKKES